MRVFEEKRTRISSWSHKLKNKVRWVCKIRSIVNVKCSPSLAVADININDKNKTTLNLNGDSVKSDEVKERRGKK